MTSTTMLRDPASVEGLAALAAALLTADGARRVRQRPRPRAPATSGSAPPPRRDPAARLLRQRHPRPAARRRRRTAPTPKTLGGTKLDDPDLQRRPRRRRGAVRRLPRRRLRRPQPGHQRVHASRRRGGPHRRRRHVRRRRSSSSSRRHHRRRPTSRARRSRRRSSATRRTSRCAPGSSDKGLTTPVTGGRRRHDRAAGERADARRCSSRARSTAPGCPSRGRRGSSLDGGGKVLVDEKSTSGRAARSSRRTSSCATDFLDEVPRDRQALLEAQVGTTTGSTANADRGRADGINAALEAAHRQDARRRRARPGVRATRRHGRPARRRRFETSADARRGGRHHQEGRPRRASTT